MKRKGGERVEEAEAEEEGEAVVLRDTSSPEEDHVGACYRERISKTQAPSSHTFCSSRRSKCKLDSKLFESHLEFVLDIYKSESGAENKQLISHISLLMPKGAPENFSTKGYPYFMNENWFTPKSVDNFCKKLQPSRSDVENCP